jgi:hypothetical protein
MEAVITLAAPSMALATGLDGSRIAAATCVQFSPASTEGTYWTWGSRYRFPMSTNGIEPPPYRAKSACCCAVGCCR